ncbi:accessory gene regulator ArgB-like protein [Paenibacillus beijingensis]|uniref:Accessory gene regulator AgrB n=1 Tax=Paenibacillus beijingensis TaxID=1126833 RepID=A0A0D5NE83_9BACL|nr:accessory gene regulator B family protein [Paenibacillus beijingensis]AJY73674.1 hypothetical protein VN24_02300 [Paenibacillus beijingensis]
MINVMAEKLAVNIKAIVPNHPASVDVLRFSLAILLNGIFIITFSLLISLFFDKTTEVATILIAFAFLRQISGGVHLKSGIACVAVSTIGITIISFSSFLNDKTVFIINIMNILLALIFSPSRIEKQTRIKKKYFPILKISSTLVVAANFVFGSPILAVTFLVQCLTLVRFPLRERRDVK